MSDAIENQDKETDGPIVSVIVTTYYRNELLQEAIESVLDQDYDPIEVIVVDDSGERHAEPVVAEYDEVQYIVFEQNRGANAARTTGVNKATGKYIQLLDDDDRLCSQKISEHVSLLESSENADVAYCAQKTIDGQLSTPHPKGRGDVLELALTFDLWACVTSTMFVQADVLDRILPLPDTPGADDTYMKIELSRLTDFDFTDEPLVVRRDLDDSRGASKGAVVGTKQVLDTYESLYDQFPPRVRREAVATAYAREAEYHLTRQNWSFQAIWAQATACYYMPEIRISRLGKFVGILFGRPGIRIAKWIYRL